MLVGLWNSQIQDYALAGWTIEFDADDFEMFILWPVYDRFGLRYN